MMTLIDGHTHLYQEYRATESRKRCVEEIEEFDEQKLRRRIDELGLSIVQTMPQEMDRVQGAWLGSNSLVADLQRRAPDRIYAFAAAEPLDARGSLNRRRLEEVEREITGEDLKGLLLTPPYGHYYANDRLIYPFYEKAVEIGFPVYFHHSHMFGDPKNCPLRYARMECLDDLVIDFPQLWINVEHMGYPWTEELLAIMARSPRLYTDIAMFIDPYVGRGRRLLLARNLAMAREYGVLDRVFYGSDYVGADLDRYCELVKREVDYINAGLDADMERQGFPPLTSQERRGLLGENVRRLWSAGRHSAGRHSAGRHSAGRHLTDDASPGDASPDSSSTVTDRGRNL
jgi:predicted TIM-barrel fold metal-dependent hydrolase